MEEASFVEEVCDFVAIVIEIEASTQIESAAIGILEVDGTGFVDRASVEEGAENGLPADPVAELALGDLDLRIHRQAHGRLPILYQVRERIRCERRDGPMVERALLESEAAVLFLQSQCSVVDAEAEGRQLLVKETPGGECRIALDRLREQIVKNFVSRQCSTIAVETGSEVDGHRGLLLDGQIAHAATVYG